MFLAVVMDLYSRHYVGWQCDKDIQTIDIKSMFYGR